MYGFSGLPHYDIAKADLVVSFGADFLGAWRSPVGYSKAYGEFRQGGHGHRGHLVQVEPRMSLTGANADEWLPARPGTEGALALALAAELLGRAGSDEEAAGWEGLSGALSLDEAAALADLPAERLHALAERLAAAETPLVLGGGAVGGGMNATEALTCVAALNRVLGAAGTTVMPNLAHAPRYSAVNDVEEFVAAAANGEVSLVIVAGVDPLHDLPDSLGLRGALDRAELVVALDSFPSDTASAADWILGHGHLFRDLGRRYFTSRKREVVGHLAAAGAETSVRHAVGHRYRSSARATVRRGTCRGPSLRGCGGLYPLRVGERMEVPGP